MQQDKLSIFYEDFYKSFPNKPKTPTFDKSKSNIIFSPIDSHFSTPIHIDPKIQLEAHHEYFSSINGKTKSKSKSMYVKKNGKKIEGYIIEDGRKRKMKDDELKLLNHKRCGSKLKNGEKCPHIPSYAIVGGQKGGKRTRNSYRCGYHYKK